MPRPSVLSRRNPHLSKKDFGHVLVIAGSPTMLGASVLTCLAAMRSGSGLVTAAVPKSLNLTLQQKIAHVVMTLPLPQTAQAVFSKSAFSILTKRFSKFNALAIGPGLGLHSSTVGLVQRLVRAYAGPMVVDADGLNALAKDPRVLLDAKGVRVLTPHAGEMSRLIGSSIEAVEKDPTTVALAFAARYDVIVLLKGHRTVVVDPAGRVYVNRTGNVGMATAGSGDVLTGMIAAYLAQGIDPFKAACLAAHDHGKAADMAIKKRSKRSLMATDLIEQISHLT